MDVDRDAPFTKEGLVHGISMPLMSRDFSFLKDPSRAAVFEGTVAGLQSFFDELEIVIPSLFFLEGRATIFLAENHTDLLKKMKSSIIGFHGMDHEDMVGSSSKIPLSLEENLKTINDGKKIIQEVTGFNPIIFRAPYMQINTNLLEKLPSCGFQFDSSLYTETSQPPFPYEVTKGLTEIPVIKYPQGSQKFLYLYLWSLFEGKRSPEEYIKVISDLAIKKNVSHDSTVPSTICLINLHPWHLAFNISEKRYLTKQECEKNLHYLQFILDELSQFSEISFELPSILKLVR